MFYVYLGMVNTASNKSIQFKGSFTIINIYESVQRVR